MIGDALNAQGVETDVRPADEAESPDAYDAVVVAGSLYMNRWHPQARRFVRRHAAALRARPVWLVSSGPLDGTARTGQIPPVPQVTRLGERIGARGLVTFGGCLAADATGFPASAMAKTQAGDWRDVSQVEELAATVSAELAGLRPVGG
jgi:menaquinone-dependent protoporphyrinogen oxidase